MTTNTITTNNSLPNFLKLTIKFIFIYQQMQFELQEEQNRKLQNQVKPKWCGLTL